MGTKTNYQPFCKNQSTQYVHLNKVHVLVYLLILSRIHFTLNKNSFHNKFEMLRFKITLIEFISCFSQINRIMNNNVSDYYKKILFLFFFTGFATTAL